MDIPLHTRHLALERGLERIIQSEHGQPELPAQQNVTPAEVEAVGQLDRLFRQPSLEDALEGAMRPVLDNRELLSPSAFRDALNRAHDELRALATEQTPDDARVLNRCARLLKDEFELRDLLAMYRGALYQG